MVPPVVGGVGLFYAFGLKGLLGQYLYDWFGVQLTYTTAAVVMAETFVAMPFLVITVETALRSMDRRFEDAAATLGAGPVTVARRVTLPMILPGLLAGAALAWARALGEFGATITFAGNIRGRTQTTPLAVVPAPPVRSRYRDRPQPRAARGVCRGARPAPRPVARRPAGSGGVPVSEAVRIDGHGRGGRGARAARPGPQGQERRR